MQAINSIMIIAPVYSNAPKIVFGGKDFVCQDLAIEGRIYPQARQKVEEFVSDLNKAIKGACIRFPYFIYFFMICYAGSFIGIMFSRKFYLMFIPVSFFLAFMAGICWFSISVNRAAVRINKTVDKYRVELAPYYTVINAIILYRRRNSYYNSEQSITLVPVQGNNTGMNGGMFMAPFPGQQYPIYNQGAYYDPNMVPNPYQPQNANINMQQVNYQQYQQFQQAPQHPQNMQPTHIGGFRGPNENPPVYNPPQNIPIYSYNPRQMDDSLTDNPEAKNFGTKNRHK